MSNAAKEDTADGTGSSSDSNLTSVTNISDSKREEDTAEDCYSHVDDMCPFGARCEDLDADCLQCEFNFSCSYGAKDLNVTCQPKPLVNCTVSKKICHARKGTTYHNLYSFIIIIHPSGEMMVGWSLFKGSTLNIFPSYFSSAILYKKQTILCILCTVACRYKDLNKVTVCVFVCFQGSQTVQRTYDCRYCYQLEPWQYECNESTSCSLLKPRNYYPARPFYTAVCKTRPTALCLGMY
jgi:hypothetical protein